MTGSVSQPVSPTFLPWPMSQRRHKKRLGGKAAYKLRLINHGRDDKLGAPDALVEGPPMQLGLWLARRRASRRLVAHGRKLPAPGH